MKWLQHLAAAAALMIIQVPVSTAAEVDADEIRSQFAGIIEGLNKNSFERFHRATVRKDMTSRIYANRLIDPAVKKSFAADFSASVEQMFSSSFPKSKSEILGTLIDFQLQGNEGRAVVRYALSGYRYAYHVYDLRVDKRGRVSIVDWLDYYQGGLFSDEAGQALVMVMPGKEATRNLLDNKGLGEREIFQMGELFKAVRDNQPERFFQIYDGLDEVLLKEKVVVRLNLHLSLKVPNSARAENAVRMLVERYPDDALYSLRLVEYYIPTRQFEKAIDELVKLQEGIGIEDGATESLKASAALAIGNMADAEKYALQATVVEPSLELAWWSLLRARTRAKNYGGATAALTRLEDDFGHILDARKLRKDRFLKVLADQQEFLDWRASRN